VRRDGRASRSGARKPLSSIFAGSGACRRKRCIARTEGRRSAPLRRSSHIPGNARGPSLYYRPVRICLSMTIRSGGQPLTHVAGPRYHFGGCRYRSMGIQWYSPFRLRVRLKRILSMPNDSRRIAREKKTMRAMVRIYCRGHHGSRGELCHDCRALLDYAYCRLDRCPFGQQKSTCAKCPIHCYKPAMRTRAKVVMRYAGPRMLWRHPILAIRHMFDGFRGVRALERGKKG
jgi:hypothetical protein